MKDLKITLLNCDCKEIPLAIKGVKGFQKGHKGKPWLGRTHTQETKEKMRAARLKNNPMHNPDVVAKRSATLKANGTFAKEKSNNCKGGKTKEHLLVRTSKEYQEWRDLVFKRDGYKCQVCQAKCGCGSDVHLHAHHIKKFSEYPELRFDVSNGVTLCVPCHRKEHSKNV